VASRRKRFVSPAVYKEDLRALETKAVEHRPPPAVTNAPYGLTIQGSLVCEDITATTTTGALTVPRMTTTQRNALTAAVGMIVYNTTASKFQGYAGSSWVNLH